MDIHCELICCSPCDQGLLHVSEFLHPDCTGSVSRNKQVHSCGDLAAVGAKASKVKVSDLLEALVHLFEKFVDLRLKLLCYLSGCRLRGLTGSQQKNRQKQQEQEGLLATPN